MAYSVPYRMALVSSKLLYSHVRDIASVRASRCGSAKVSTLHIFPRISQVQKLPFGGVLFFCSPCIETAIAQQQ